MKNQWLVEYERNSVFVITVVKILQKHEDYMDEGVIGEGKGNKKITKYLNTWFE